MTDGTAKQPKIQEEETTSRDRREDEFSSKAQVMTLMTTDVDRVSGIAWQAYALVGLFTPLTSQTNVNDHWV